MHVLEDSAIFSSLQDQQGIKGNASGRRERRAIIRNSFLALITLASCAALVCIFYYLMGSK